MHIVKSKNLLKWLVFVFAVTLFVASCAPKPTATPVPTPTPPTQIVATPTATPTKAPATPTSTPSFKGSTVVAYTWGGIWDDAMYAGVCATVGQKWGAKCSLIPGSSVGNLSKAIAEKGDPQADFLEIDDAIVPRAIANGVTKKVDFTKIPNAKGFFKGISTFNDQFVPYGSQLIGLAYRTDKVKTKPTKWSDLWTVDEYAGHIVVMAWNYNFAWAFIEAAAVVATGDPKKIDEGYAKIKELRPKIMNTLDSQATWTKLNAEGEAWVSVQSNGRVWGEADKGIPVAFVLPSDWPMYNFWGFISLSDKNKDLLHLFYNEMLDAEYQAKWIELVPYGPPTTTATKYMRIIDRVRTLDTEDEFAPNKMPDWDYLEKRRQEFTDKFNKEIAK
ncbi:MAG: extracellular solute-binding protein [Chloroflexi bacterium]|nr:extracellular solute-binding protein [Chloroflexota bacterium]